MMAIRATDKKPMFGNKRSHACNATKHTQKLNMQKVSIDGKTFLTTAREAKKIKNSI